MIKRNVIITLFSLIMATSIISCAGHSTDAIQTTLVQKTPTVTFTESSSAPTVTMTPTTDVFVTPVSTATSTPTIPPEVSLISNCLEVQLPSIEEVPSNGIVIYELWSGSDTYFLDMATGYVTQANGNEEGFTSLAVSPDSARLAYERLRFENGVVIENDLVVTTSKGDLLKEILWEDDWYFWPLTWLNQEQLSINLISQENNQASSEYPKILILNPFTGEREIVALDFPELSIPIGPGSTIASWSPRLDQVVYVQGDANTWSGPIYYTLWDATAGQPITKLEILDDVNAMPRWRQDGEIFAIAQNFVVGENIHQSFEMWPYYEIHLINSQGEISQLTNLTDYYPYTYIEDLSWSPDGKQIAFWFSHWGEHPEGLHVYGEQQLAIVDTTTGEITY